MSCGASVLAQEAKMLRVADLLRAKVWYGEIAKIVGVSKRMIANVRKRMEDGDDLKEKARKPNFDPKFAFLYFCVISKGHIGFQTTLLSLILLRLLLRVTNCLYMALKVKV